MPRRPWNHGGTELALRRTSPEATTRGVGETAIASMSAAAKVGLSVSAVASPRCFSSRPVAASCRSAMTKADAEFMDPNSAIREAASLAAEDTTCVHSTHPLLNRSSLSLLDHVGVMQVGAWSCVHYFKAPPPFLGNMGVMHMYHACSGHPQFKA